MPPITRDEKLRTYMIARAWGVLAGVRRPITERIGVQVRNERGRVRISVNPPGETATDGPRVGRWLSPTCSLILLRLGSDTVMRTKLAERCGMAYDPRFKALVTELLERGILEEPEDESGVRAVRA